MNNTLEYLQKEIKENMSVKDIVDIFEQACQPMGEEDMILFETGTYDFTGEELFYFSLVKQFPMEDDDEFYQIHVDILYKPCDENKSFHKTVWDEDLDEDIFDYIRKIDDYHYAENAEHIRAEIYIEET